MTNIFFGNRIGLGANLRYSYYRVLWGLGSSEKKLGATLGFKFYGFGCR